VTKAYLYGVLAHKEETLCSRAHGGASTLRHINRTEFNCQETYNDIICPFAVRARRCPEWPHENPTKWLVTGGVELSFHVHQRHEILRPNGASRFKDTGNLPREEVTPFPITLCRITAPSNQALMYNVQQKQNPYAISMDSAGTRPMNTA
jgi:hypothetical protein